MKFLIVGDIHIRGDNPGNRIGNYYQDCKKKLQEIIDIANQNSAEIIQVGDFFNGHSIAYTVIGDLMNFLYQQYKNIYAIAGNHDIIGHNEKTLERTALGLLMNTGYIKKIDDNRYFGDVEVIGKSFNHDLDLNYQEYKTPEKILKTQILVVHGMLLPDRPGFEMRHSLIDEAADVTNADVVISGHYHEPFIKKRKDKLFINPGALMRISATESEINRTPHVVLLDTDKIHDAGYYPEIIELRSAKPGYEVLDRTQVAANTLRAESMQKFIQSLDFGPEAHFLDIREIIEVIAEKEKIQLEIAREAINRIQKVREKAC